LKTAFLLPFLVIGVSLGPASALAAKKTAAATTAGGCKRSPASAGPQFVSASLIGPGKISFTATMPKDGARMKFRIVTPGQLTVSETNPVSVLGGRLFWSTADATDASAPSAENTFTGFIESKALATGQQHSISIQTTDDCGTVISTPLPLVMPTASEPVAPKISFERASASWVAGSFLSPNRIEGRFAVRVSSDAGVHHVLILMDGQPAYQAEDLSFDGTYKTPSTRSFPTPGEGNGPLAENFAFPSATGFSLTAVASLHPSDADKPHRFEIRVVDNAGQTATVAVPDVVMGKAPIFVGARPDSGEPAAEEEKPAE
jgi:hypothetical protein